MKEEKFTLSFTADCLSVSLGRFFKRGKWMCSDELGGAIAALLDGINSADACGLDVLGCLAQAVTLTRERWGLENDEDDKVYVNFLRAAEAIEKHATEPKNE